MSSLKPGHWPFLAHMLVVTAALLACGGKASVEAGPAAGGPIGDASPAADGSPSPGGPPLGVLVADCPATPPVNASPCAHPRLDCEYGSDWNPSCNTVAQCFTQGFWQVAPPSTDPTQCPTPTGLGPGCPAAHALATGVCASNAVCAYPEGICACLASFGPGPTQFDASATYAWTCASPDPVCPVSRPRIGSTCTQAGLSCNYAVCGTYGGAFYCNAGVWGEGIDINTCSGGG